MVSRYRLTHIPDSPYSYLSLIAKLICGCAWSCAVTPPEGRPTLAQWAKYCLNWAELNQLLKITRKYELRKVNISAYDVLRGYRSGIFLISCLYIEVRPKPL
jgi:hypothetical protein